MKRGPAKVSRVLLSSMVLAFSLSSLASAQAPPPTPNSVQMRMKLQDFVAGPDGAKRLAILKKAVAKMRSPPWAARKGSIRGPRTMPP